MRNPKQYEGCKARSDAKGVHNVHTLSFSYCMTLCPNPYPGLPSTAGPRGDLVASYHSGAASYTSAEGFFSLKPSHAPSCAPRESTAPLESI